VLWFRNKKTHKKGSLHRNFVVQKSEKHRRMKSNNWIVHKGIFQAKFGWLESKFGVENWWLGMMVV